MDKKYLKYSVLILSLLVYKPSFSMDYENSAAGIVVATTLFTFGLLRLSANVDKDVPKVTQDWARKELKLSRIKNAETVPFKIAPKGESWCASARNVYIPEDFDLSQISDKERIYGVHSLKHEMKHYNNSDCLKAVLLGGATVCLGSCFSIDYPYLAPAIIPLVAGVNLAYARYREEGAERFAFEHARDRQEISVTQEKFKVWLSYAESCLYNGISLDDSKIKKSLISLLAPHMVKVTQQLRNNDLDDEAQDRLQNKQDFIVKVADFIRDPKHPSLFYHREMVQEYLDKWDKKQSEIDSALQLRRHKQG